MSTAKTTKVRTARNVSSRYPGTGCDRLYDPRTCGLDGRHDRNRRTALTELRGRTARLARSLTGGVGLCFRQIEYLEAITPSKEQGGCIVPCTGSSVVPAPLADVEAPVPDAAPSVALARGARSRILSWVLATGAVLAVFFVHFRPWQGGLLEDWGLVQAWDTEGFGGFVTRLPLTLGRPLHLLPDYVGMALSNGGFVGYYAVLGAVAVAQLVAALWAVAPLTNSRSLRWAVALALALHPWWAAGDILRFMSAQVSVLGVVLWLGASIRFLANGRVSWAVLLVVAPMAGLLSYQAPAAAIVLAAVVVAPMSRAGWRRQIALVVLTVGTSVAAKSIRAPAHTDAGANAL